MFNIFTALDELGEKIKAPIEQGIQAQYRNTNLQKLIAGIIAIRTKYLIRAFESMITHNINLATAKGDGLDLWGQLIGFRRYVLIDEVSGLHYDLTDDEFRSMLYCVFQKQFIKGDIVSANTLVNSVLGSFADVAVKDTTDMSYQIYVFNKRLPAWLLHCLENRDVLPRPACVGVGIEQEAWSYFGFAPDDSDKDTNPEAYKARKEWFDLNIGNFESTIFKDIATYDGWQVRQDWFKAHIGNFDNSIWDKYGEDNLMFGFAPERDY